MRAWRPSGLSLGALGSAGHRAPEVDATGLTLIGDSRTGVSGMSGLESKPDDANHVIVGCCAATEHLCSTSFLKRACPVWEIRDLSGYGMNGRISDTKCLLIGDFSALRGNFPLFFGQNWLRLARSGLPSTPAFHGLIGEWIFLVHALGTQDSPRIGLKMFKSKLTVVNSDILSTKK